MKIVADGHIPYIKGILDKYADVDYIPAENIDNHAVRDADILLIRTPTKCTPLLLSGSRCRFIMTASIGIDHIDTRYCSEHGIMWKNAPGCNAYSVAQYVLSSLLLYTGQTHKQIKDLTVGIVGAGHVGRAVSDYLSKVGFKVLLNDPPREKAEGVAGFVSLDEMAATCDVISMHTPLVKDGDYPTYHLADDKFFNSLKHSPLFINSARGGVVDDKVLLKAKLSGKISEFIIDCWENEPAGIYTPLIKEAFISTPHIAGYSDDGKANGSRTAINEIAKFLGVQIKETLLPILPPNSEIDLKDIQDPLYTAVLHSYNPQTDSFAFKEKPADFEKFRVHYPLRREFGAYKLVNVQASYIPVLKSLGFAI